MGLGVGGDCCGVKREHTVGISLRKQMDIGRVMRSLGLMAALIGTSSCGIFEPIQANGVAGALPFPLRGLPKATINLTMHPLGNLSPSRGLSLFSAGQINFSEAVQTIVGERLPNGVHLDMHQTVLPPQVGGGGRRFDGKFMVNGIAIFGTQIAAHMLKGREPFLLGTMPNVSASAVANALKSWPDLDSIKGVVARSVAEQGLDTKDLQLVATERFYFPTSANELRPAWLFVAKIGKLPYEVLADDSTVFSFSRRYFEVDGSASIHPNNKNDSALVNYTLKDLSGDGTLTSQYLKTNVPTDKLQAIEASHRFNYQPNDSRFAQPNAYAHTDEHFRWMLGLGGKTYGALPLHLELHQLINMTKNNALFIPGNEKTGEPFVIQLGDGDGEGLQNLATDSDVPSHESGHYFVYNYLKVTRDEPLGIHEGVADLLVYLHKRSKGIVNAACLGESICPPGTPFCVKSGCLRTADNEWVYNDTSWKQWSAQMYGSCCGHKHGQVIGGVVWDLVKNKTMSAPDAANLTMTAITYFKADSGIRDFLLALLIADKTVFNCSYDSAIRQAIGKRNFGSFIADAPAGCENLPQLTGTGDNSLAPSDEPAVTKSSSSKPKIFGISCGTVGGTSPLPSWFVLAILLTPALASAIAPVFAKVVVRSRRNSRRHTRSLEG